MVCAYTKSWVQRLLACLCTFSLTISLALAAETVSRNPTSDRADFLFKQAEQVKSADNARFQKLLRELQQRESSLDTLQRWHLRYLLAWQKDYDGDFNRASAMLVSIIDDSHDVTLRFRATATLINILTVTHRYDEAYMRLNELMSQLPDISDRAARFQGLGEASQMLASAGQYDLAIEDAQEMQRALPPGETMCKAKGWEVHARFKSGSATSSDPDFQRVIEVCDQAGESLFAALLRADVAAMYLREDSPKKAVALLERHYSEVKSKGYVTFMASLDALLAKAYLASGNLSSADSHAEAAVKVAGKGEFTESLSNAYEVLYKIARMRGDYLSALQWHEKYMASDKGYLNDISARALAYQRVRQQVQARKQQIDALNSQNKILQLQQALDRKAVQASRLSIILLLTVLASIGFWLYRLRRSQRRYMRLARHDGLTGIYNRQHFVEQAEQKLAAAKKAERDACLILIDLDHFKLINDSHGHAVGDLVLKRAVAVCHDHLRSTDIFGRLGGEEFGILLPDCGLAQVADRAEAMRVTISSMTEDEDAQGIVVSASLGIASTEYSGYELRQLMSDADDALYRAKRAGRNRVVVDGVQHEARTAPV